MKRLPHTSDRFLAFGDVEGDAFLLERGRTKILVDGGLSDAIVGCLKKAVRENYVDIVVCTHNDDDHAKGIVYILEDAVDVGEIWLPGSWTFRLDDLLREPVKFAEELVQDIEELPKGERNRSLERLGEKWSKLGPDNAIDGGETGTEHEAPDPFDACYLGLLGGLHGRFSGPQRRAWLLTQASMGFAPKSTRFNYSLLGQACTAARNIAEITIRAYQRSIRIRWFEYGRAPGGKDGLPSLLTVINGTETRVIRRPKMSALMYLALTTSNRQSLVLYSPGGDKAPAILFASDSDLTFHRHIRMPVLDSNVLVTVPHHGSEANRRAYHVLRKSGACSKRTVWVRGDYYKCMPGCHFRSAQGRKYCTNCRRTLSGQGARQDVRLFGWKSSWRKAVQVRPCICR